MGRSAVKTKCPHCEGEIVINVSATAWIDLLNSNKTQVITKEDE